MTQTKQNFLTDFFITMQFQNGITAAKYQKRNGGHQTSDVHGHCRTTLALEPEIAFSLALFHAFNFKRSRLQSTEDAVKRVRTRGTISII